MSDYKVALVSHEFPPFLIGGMASHCYDLACSLSRNKVPTTVFCGMSKNISFERLNPYLEVIRLPCLNFPPRFLWFQLQNFKVMLRMLENFDIIHCVNPLASAFFSFFAKKLKKPIIASIHEVFLSNLKVFINAPFYELSLGDLTIHGVSYPLNELSMRILLKNADRIVICGRSALQDLKQIYPKMIYKKFHVIYNGVNVEEFEKNFDNSPEINPSIIFYGRLVWIKGVLFLLRAIAILKHELPDITLKIYGRGPLEAKIRSCIRKLKLSENVLIEGYIPRSKLIEKIKKSSAVVLPSLYEVGPFISGLEAMACRKPLITFDFPFTREFVINMHNGVLAKARDTKDLADKIRLVLLNGKLKKELGQNAFNYVKKRHNWYVLVRNYLEIYESCLD
jgi:glycosyltransferase involved in cell wall biosynthesis